LFEVGTLASGVELLGMSEMDEVGTAHRSPRDGADHGQPPIVRVAAAEHIRRDPSVRPRLGDDHVGPSRFG
jgi:hypothetical protein